MKATLNKAKDVLTIEIPFDKKGSLSGSGKSFTLASTSGNQGVNFEGIGKVMIGVNAYKKAKAA